MATVLENITTRRNNVALELAEFTANKPSYAIDGQSVQWESYRASLIKELMDLNELLNMLDPYEIPTVMS